MDRVHYHLSELKKHDYTHLPYAWSAGGAAFIAFDSELTGIIQESTYQQTSCPIDTLIKKKHVQDWKTLWFDYQQNESVEQLALLLPTTAKIDMNKFSKHLGVYEIDLQNNLGLSKTLPKLHTPGTSGPWTPQTQTQPYRIIVDSPSYHQTDGFVATSWAFPGITGSKVYIPDMKKTLQQIINPTASIEFADIAKQ